MNILEAPLVRLSPSEIKFRHNPHCAASVSLQIVNTIEEPVAFKIKTNRKDRYFITPFEGVIDPYESEKIVVAIEPSSNADLRDVLDKFLIQSVRCNQPGLNVTKLWRRLEKTPSKCFQKFVLNVKVESVNRTKRIKKMTLRKAMPKKKKRFPQLKRYYTEDLTSNVAFRPPLRGVSESRFPRKLIVDDEDHEMSEPPPFRRDPAHKPFATLEPFKEHRRNFSTMSSPSNILEPPAFPPRVREYTVEGVTHYLSHPMNSRLRLEDKLAFLRRQRVSDDLIIQALRAHLTTS